MSEIHGIRLPSLPAHPTVRRKIPSPFKRRAVEVAAPAVRREWRRIPAGQLRIGDNVPGVGELYTVVTDFGGKVRIEGGERNHATYRADEAIFAYTAVS